MEFLFRIPLHNFSLLEGLTVTDIWPPRHWRKYYILTKMEFFSTLYAGNSSAEPGGSCICYIVVLIQLELKSRKAGPGLLSSVNGSAVFGPFSELSLYLDCFCKWNPRIQVPQRTAIHSHRAAKIKAWFSQFFTLLIFLVYSFIFQRSMKYKEIFQTVF